MKNSSFLKYEIKEKLMKNNNSWEEELSTQDSKNLYSINI